MIALNEVWRLRAKADGGVRERQATQTRSECLWSDSIDVDGVLMCNIKSLHGKKRTLSVALMLLKFY